VSCVDAVGTVDQSGEVKEDVKCTRSESEEREKLPNDFGPLASIVLLGVGLFCTRGDIAPGLGTVGQSC
jgi:hypothetical protein